MLTQLELIIDERQFFVTDVPVELMSTDDLLGVLPLCDQLVSTD